MAEHSRFVGVVDRDDRLFASCPSCGRLVRGRGMVTDDLASIPEGCGLLICRCSAPFLVSAAEAPRGLSEEEEAGLPEAVHALLFEWLVRKITDGVPPYRHDRSHAEYVDICTALGLREGDRE